MASILTVFDGLMEDVGYRQGVGQEVVCLQCQTGV